MNHPAEKKLRLYYSGNMPEYLAADLEGHLAACEDCAARGRRILLEDTMLNHTAASHALAYQLQEAREALENSPVAANIGADFASRARDALGIGVSALRQMASDSVTPLVAMAGFSGAMAPLRKLGEAIDAMFTIGPSQLATLTKGAPGTLSGRSAFAVAVEQPGEYIIVSLEPVLVLSVEGGAVRVVDAPRLAGANYWSCALTTVSRGAIVVIIPE